MKTLMKSILLVLLIPVICLAGESGNSLSDIKSTSVLKFTAGVVSGFLIHEGGHLLVGELTDTRLDWETGTYNQLIGFKEYSNSSSKGVAINSAGLISQAIGSEIILQVDKIDKNDAYVRGMMAWNIINPITYSLDYWIFRNTNKVNGNSYRGDIAGIEHYSSKDTANGFAIGMTAIAVFQGYRFLKTQSWSPDWLRKDYKVSLAPMPSGGFMVGYKIDF